MKIALYLAFGLLLFGCSEPKPKTPIDIINENIAAYIQENAHDPSTYEPVETSILDTVYAVHEMKRLLLESRSDSINYSNIIEAELIHIENLREFDSETTKTLIELSEESIDDYMVQIQKNTAAITLLGEKLKTTKEGLISHVLARHKYRIANEFGALTLKESYVALDVGLSIAGLGETKGELPWIPGEFPGKGEYIMIMRGD